MTVQEEKYLHLVDGLIRGTAKLEIAWQSSARSDAFVAVLGRGMVEITRSQELLEDDTHPTEWFDLFILDSNGRVADKLSSSPSLSGWDSTAFDVQRLSELYKAARANALGTNSVIDGLLGELSALK